MNLPISFPDEATQIREDAARFRALSPDEQVQELEESFRLYHFLRSTSGRAEEIDRMAEEEELAQKNAIMEFARRHG